jgi:histidine phosphotransferase ChpT
MGEHCVNLTALIGSRICHDLISPIGAISNGLELLELTQTMEGPELALIAESAGSAGARIRFFRIAYGAAGDQMLGRVEVTSVLRDIGRDSRLSVDWQPMAPQNRSEVRMAFLALQCLETAMPLGGVVTIAVDNGQWCVEGRAERIDADRAPLEILTGTAPGPEITPAQVQFALLPLHVADAGRRIETEIGAGRITLRF